MKLSQMIYVHIFHYTANIIGSCPVFDDIIVLHLVGYVSDEP